jgi:hypothetical protein
MVHDKIKRSVCVQIAVVMTANEKFVLYAGKSVGDPDPHVFGPSGSGSIIQRYGFGSGSRSFSFLKNVLSGVK